MSAPSGARFQRVKVPNPPGSGKDIAESKGVHREVESEGNQKKVLCPGDKPVVYFSICDGDEVEAVYAYCNLLSF